MVLQSFDLISYFYSNSTAPPTHTHTLVRTPSLPAPSVKILNLFKQLLDPCTIISIICLPFFLERSNLLIQKEITDQTD